MPCRVIQCCTHPLVPKDHSEINSLRSTQRHTIRRAHTHLWKHAIRQDWLQSDIGKTQTQSLLLSISLTHTPIPTHKRSGPVHKDLSFYQQEPRQQKKKKEKMIVCCSLSMHSDTHVPGNVKGKWIFLDWLWWSQAVQKAEWQTNAKHLHQKKNVPYCVRLHVCCIMFLIETGYE